MNLQAHWHCLKCGAANEVLPKEDHPCYFCGWDGRRGTSEEMYQLRAETGHGLQECKSALKAAFGDVEQAKRILLTRGLA